MKLIAIEGNTQRLDGGAMFGNAPKEMWKKWAEPDEKNRIHLACRSLLVQTDDGRNILFDAGIGAFFEPKLRERYGVVESEHLLLETLKKMGIREEEIDVVILSHLHFDHAGGLLSPYEAGSLHLLFPKAKYYLGKEHLVRARTPHIRDRASFVPVLNQLLEESGRLILIDQPEHPDLNFGIHFTFSHGHTPGLMVLHLELPSGPLVFVTDVAPGLAWLHLPITMGYDRYPELLVNEKKELLDSLIAKNGKVFFTHDPKISCATVKQDEKGKYFGEPAPLP